MKLCVIVGNSLRKDPRVIKQIQCALSNGIDVYFVGYWDENFNQEFLQSIGCPYSIINLGKKYQGHLKSIFKKLYRELMHNYLPVKLMVKAKPDVIHANDFNTLIQAYIASKICGAKVLYDSHEICSENIGIADSKLRKNAIIFFERILLKRIGAMVSVSNSAAKYFKKKYNIPLPTVVTNCPYREHVMQQHYNNNHRFEVLYQGQMYRGRGYEQFVESAHYINDNIVLVLRGYGSIENELRGIVEKNKLQNNVRFDPPVEIKDLVTKAAESNVGVVLTQPVNINFELTVSNKLFEYLHAELPVILSDVPEHRYLNSKYNFGIIVSDFSPKGIADCINRLASDSKEYNRLKRNATIAAKELCWENESKKLLTLYKNLSSKN
jgi:glycosyltransferase involved in cell wall biosynthesis